MFNKMLVPALVLAAATVALPAAAQSYGGHHNNGGHNGGHNGGGYSQNAGYGWQSINQRQANLVRRIDMGVRSGAISRRESARLRGEFNQISRLEQTYRRNGLNAWERADLDRRFDRLSASIRSERWDNDNRRGHGRGRG